MPLDPLAPLPLVTAGLPGLGGRLKTIPDDFEVEEIPAYQPNGTGDYLYLWIEKRAMGAEFFLRRLAQRLELPVSALGTAGLKDRHAVTRQMVSVPAAAEVRLNRLDGDGIRVLAVNRHGNKLRPGHLHGNRFRVLLRDVSANAADNMGPLLDRLRRHGLPNYYGTQRFGHDGETVRLGLSIIQGQGSIRGPRLTPFLRKLALSAVQSALFNQYLARRFADGLLRTVLPGDVMAKWPFGGMFRVDDLVREQQRFEARETVPAGPIFGKKMYPAAAEAVEREQAVLTEAGLSRTAFQGFGKLLSGTRRHNLVYNDDLTAAVEPEGIRVTFTLPAGSYATVLLAELTHNQVGTEEDS